MRRLELSVNLLLLLLPFAIGTLFVCALTTPVNMIAMLLCYGLGMVSFAHAKSTLFRRGIWISFGSARMLSKERLAYRTGYALILSGALVNILYLLF